MEHTTSKAILAYFNILFTRQFKIIHIHHIEILIAAGIDLDIVNLVVSLRQFCSPSASLSAVCFKFSGGDLLAVSAAVDDNAGIFRDQQQMGYIIGPLLHIRGRDPDNFIALTLVQFRQFTCREHQDPALERCNQNISITDPDPDRFHNPPSV